MKKVSKNIWFSQTQSGPVEQKQFSSTEVGPLIFEFSAAGKTDEEITEFLKKG
jgi:hypothetical protein